MRRCTNLLTIFILYILCMRYPTVRELTIFILYILCMRYPTVRERDSEERVDVLLSPSATTPPPRDHG
jgi:hypothetical protein